MKNAWIVKPAAATATQNGGTVAAGAIANVLSDYAGVGVQLTMNGQGNSAYVGFDLGADMAIDTIMVFGLALQPAGTTMNIYYATAAQGPFTGQSVGDNSGIALACSSSQQSKTGISLWSKPAPVVARYVRVQYVAPSAGQSVRISRVVIGQRIELDRNFGFGAGFGVRDLGALDFSRRGVLVRSRGAKLRTLSLAFSHVHRDEVTAMVRPLLEQVGNSEMVAVLPDPDGTTLTDRPAYYGPLAGDDLETVWRSADGWEWKANLVSIF